MTGALKNVSTTSVSRGQRNSNSSKLDKATTTKQPPPRMIQPQHQNWLARFLRIKPAVSVLCFQVSKVRARKEVAGLFREWRKYGIRDIVVEKDAGRIWARVAEKNCKTIPFFLFLLKLFAFFPNIVFFFISATPLHFFLDFDENYPPTLTPSQFQISALNIKPVSLAVELFTVLHHGRKANLSLGRFTQEHGAKSSFGRVMEAVESVLMAREFLVEEGGRKGAMVRILGGT